MSVPRCSLQNQRAAEEELNRFQHDKAATLTDSQIELIQSLSENIPALWHSPATSSTDRQTIVRALIDEVCAEVIDNSERVDVTIRWCGGYQSHHQMTRAVGCFDQLESSDLIRQRIIQLKRRGHCHEAVADDLNRLGYRSAQNSVFTKAVVSQLVRQFRAAGDPCEAVGGYENYWTLPLLSAEIKVPASTLHNWKQRAWLTAIASGQRWIIRADKEELDRLTRLARLAEHQRGPQCRTTPAELTTPRNSD
ncbi:MAG: hypothetical protein KDA96_04660 [Planctomycetaceae bacterium]|nr:hypothetical protein [Planctomycetaceae bacterium]